MKHTLSSLALALMLVSAQSAVYAQEDTLPEIVVTAQKREQKLEDVPISVFAISGDSLESQGAYNFREILQSIPGLSFVGNEPGQSNYTIRGVSTGASSPTTGVYLDDVSLLTISTNFSGAVDPPVFDLERIEVLKGPQGTLYGGSAMGGAIKYVSRQPQLDSTEVNVAGGLATTANGAMSYNVESVANIPLVGGKLAMRAGLQYRDDGGYIDYVPNAQGEWLNHSATNPPAPFQPVAFASHGTVVQSNANEDTNLVGRLAFKLDLDGLVLLPQAVIQRNREAAPPDYWENLPRYQASYRYEQPTDDHLNLFNLSMSKDFSGIGLTSLTAYSDRSVNWQRDYTFFVGALLPALLPDPTSARSDTATHTFSEEVRLASTNPDARLKWTTGLLYAQQADTLVQIVDTVGGGTFFGNGTDIVYSGIQATKTKQYAAFADVTYSITHEWDASVGLRWFKIDQTYNGIFDGVFNGGASSVNNKKSTDTGVNPKYTVSYHVGDHELLYATAAKGFRPGGPNRFESTSSLCEPDFKKLGITKVPDSFGSDSLWTYEIGSKNEFNGGKSVVNAAVYYTDWMKIQQQVNLPSCGFQFISNVGAATIKGVELELKTIVVSGLTAGVSGNYNKSQITATEPGVSAQVGQPVLDSPQWMANAFAEVALPTVAGWSTTLRADYEYHGSMIGQFDSTAVVTTPSGGSETVADTTQTQQAYELVNASLEARSGVWQTRLYINNLTNASPLLYTGLARILDSPLGMTLRPRTVGILVRTKF
jgi:iron complex outermembrane recepter protein